MGAASETPKMIGSVSRCAVIRHARSGLARLLIGLLLALGLVACGAAPEPAPLLPWGLKGQAEAPRLDVPDHDRDGVENARDRCPDLAEDVDGFADDDGCPDPDHDGDGVPDEKEPRSGS